MNQTLQRAGEIDHEAVRFMDRTAIPMLRLSLAIIYLWFGFLKIIGKSSVADLVAKTVFF